MGVQVCRADGQSYGECTGCSVRDASSPDSAHVEPVDAHVAGDTGHIDATVPDARDDGVGGSCTLGAQSCDGTQPETCTGAGTWQPVGAPCSGDTPTCLAGACVGCTPKSTRCSGDASDLGLETCSDIGIWSAPVACPAASPTCSQAGDAGTCVCPAAETVCGGTCVDLQTDSNNCGACGTACAGTCAAPECFVTLGSGGDPYAIAVDATDVYWTAASSGAVLKAPLVGGTPTTLAFGVRPDCIAVDATSVYWTDGSETVMSVPLGGGTPTTLATAQDGSAGLAVDDTNVYWANAFGGAGGGAVMKVPKGGGTAITLASGGDPYAIVLDATNVYWTNGGTIMRVAKGGGTPTTLAISPGAPEGIAVDATSVYWTVTAYGTATGTVMKVAVAGGMPITLASGQDEPSSIAVDSTDAYWTNFGNGKIVSIPLSGGTPAVVASGQEITGSGAMGITVDATSVYWTNGSAVGAGTVTKATPK